MSAPIGRDWKHTGAGADAGAEGPGRGSGGTPPEFGSHAGRDPTAVGTAPAEEHPSRVVARRLWNAIAAGDESALRAVLAPEPVWRMYGRNPFTGTYRGVDAILGMMASVGEAADELQSDLIDVFVSDWGAVLRYSVHALRPGRILDVEHLLLIRIEAGRVAELTLAPLDQHRADRFWNEPPPRGRPEDWASPRR